MDPDSGAGLLHRLTSYAPGLDWAKPTHDDPRLRHDLPANAPEIEPPQFKAYQAELPSIALPAELPEVGVAATAVLAGASFDPQQLDAAQLGRILFLGAGVVRVRERDGREMFFRASGSAGARFPLEVYASTRDVHGVPDGVYWYDARNHALVRIAPPAQGQGTTLIITGVPWRTGWRYRERGWRHIYWDGGTLVSQLTAAAHGAGLRPALRTSFPDGEIAELVGADGVHEFPIALVTLGDGTPAVRSTGAAVSGELPPVEMPVCTLAQRAGYQETLGEPWADGAPLSGYPSADSLDEVIAQRGSQRRMDRGKTLPRSVLEWSMAAAMRGIIVPHWIAVHGVDDMPPGLYRWPVLSAPVRAGGLRDELYEVCLRQGLAADAAFVVISAVAGRQLDDHGYREAQLAAGIVEGRLHLAAYALGAGASGMTFYDSGLPRLLGEPDDLVTLLFTCVGVPEYRGRRGGRPGAPVTFKPVTPRIGEH